MHDKMIKVLTLKDETCLSMRLHSLGTKFSKYEQIKPPKLFELIYSYRSSSPVLALLVLYWSILRCHKIKILVSNLKSTEGTITIKYIIQFNFQYRYNDI